MSILILVLSVVIACNQPEGDVEDTTSEVNETGKGKEEAPDGMIAFTVSYPDTLVENEQVLIETGRDLLAVADKCWIRAHNNELFHRNLPYRIIRDFDVDEVGNAVIDSPYHDQTGDFPENCDPYYDEIILYIPADAPFATSQDTAR